MNLTCIRTVFKMKSRNFTGTSVALWDRSRKGWRFYYSPIGVRNKGLITQQTRIQRAFAQFSRLRVETSQERRWLTGTGRGAVDDSTYPRGVRNKGLITQKTWIQRAFAQFSRLRVETSQERRRHPGTGRGRVDDSTVFPQGSEIKG